MKICLYIGIQSVLLLIYSLKRLKLYFSQTNVYLNRKIGLFFFFKLFSLLLLIGVNKKGTQL